MVTIKQFSYKFEVPQIAKFKGKEYPRDHLRKFKYSCYLISNNDVLMLSTFLMNLAGQALDWYNNLSRHSIYSFEQLASLFLEHFSINIRKGSTITDLTGIFQYYDESINDYVVRWRVIIIDFLYALPQEELIRIFCKSYNKSISSNLQIQQHKYFEDVLSQAKLIKEVKIQSGDIKLRKKNQDQNQKRNENFQVYHE